MNLSSDPSSADISTVYNVDRRRSNRIQGRSPSYDLEMPPAPRASNQPPTNVGTISPHHQVALLPQQPLPAMAPYNSNSSSSHSAHNHPAVVPPSVQHQVPHINHPAMAIQPPHHQQFAPHHQPPVNEVQIHPRHQNIPAQALPRQIFPPNQLPPAGGGGPPYNPRDHASSSSSHQSTPSHQSSGYE